ncbi:MAG: hypothetical protein ACYCWW_08080, partial [Deltaproteobacteria bacterium]
MQRLGRIALFAVLPLAACPITAPDVGGHPITCSSTSDCQPGELCDKSYGQGYCIAAPDAGSVADAGSCTVAGKLYAAGALGDTACQSCQPGVSTTQLSPYTGLPADGGCPVAGELCNAGQCAPGCDVDGIFYAPGASGGNACEVCNPSKSNAALSPLTGVPPDGGCPGGEVCAGGTCSAGCVIGGAFV